MIENKFHSQVNSSNFQFVDQYFILGKYLNVSFLSGFFLYFYFVYKVIIQVVTLTLLQII